MSEFNLVWRRYGIKDNPYFQGPITSDDPSLIASFVGRTKERAELKKALQIGTDLRYCVIGEPGVGKTSLLNVVRKEASEKRFFTPSSEIEINHPMSGNEFIVLTLSAVYNEVKKQGIALNEKLMGQLESFYNLTSFAESLPEITKLTLLNRNKLLELFREVVKELVEPRFHALILHYDNLDNIEIEKLTELFSDIRDFLLTKKVIFIFVGDEYLATAINARPRVSQIFLSPCLEIAPLSEEN